MQLNTPHALWLLLIATVMGILSLYGLQVTRRMTKSPAQYRRKLFEERSTHLLAGLSMQTRGEVLVRRWGGALSRLALVYVVFSFATVVVVSILLILDRAGMDSVVSPIVEVLSKVEADLAC